MANRSLRRPPRTHLAALSELVVATSNDVIGLQPNQAVTVIAQYPLDSVGRRISAVPLDGGRILGASTGFVEVPIEDHE